MKKKINMYETFKQYKVEADSVEDFLNKYTKSNRHQSRGIEYVKARIDSHKKDLNRYGYTFITHHDSVTGETVSYYG